MRINLFGNLRITCAGRPVTSVNTNRLHSLMAYLILHGDTPLPRERVAFMLWPASNESQARTNLRQLLHHLKRALPVECSSLVTDHFAVHWRQDGSCEVDTIEFQAAIVDASTAQTEKDCARETQSLTTAAQLYTDDLLPALYDDWLIPLREDYRRRISDVLHRLATLLEEQKDYAAAIPCTERLIALDSLNESNHRLLIRLHAANNDRASALRTYHQCMRVLRREMGVEPSPATLELFERILKAGPEASREPTSGTPESAAAQPIAQLQKARALVGRTMEWHQLATVWQFTIEDGPRVAVISGEPGIGKTRLAEELYESCVRQGYAAARSRCYAGQGQVPYAPVAEWLRSDAIRAGWTARSGIVPALRPHHLETSTDRCVVAAPFHVFVAWPHEHLLGRSFQAALTTGAGAATLIDVPSWNFAAEAPSVLDRDVAAGDLLDVTCTWFNSTDDYVLPGPKTTDEMCGLGMIVSPPLGARLPCTAG